VGPRNCPLTQHYDVTTNPRWRTAAILKIVFGHNSTVDCPISVAKHFFSEFQQWDMYLRSTARICCIVRRYNPWNSLQYTKWASKVIQDQRQLKFSPSTAFTSRMKAVTWPYRVTKTWWLRPLHNGTYIQYIIITVWTMGSDSVNADLQFLWE